MNLLAYGLVRIAGDRAHFDGIRTENGFLSLPFLSGTAVRDGVHRFNGHFQKVGEVTTLCLATALATNLPTSLRLCGQAIGGKIEGSPYRASLPDGSFEGSVIGLVNGEIVLVDASLENAGAGAVTAAAPAGSAPAPSVEAPPAASIESVPVAPVVEASAVPVPETAKPEPPPVEKASPEKDALVLKLWEEPTTLILPTSVAPAFGLTAFESAGPSKPPTAPTAPAAPTASAHDEAATAPAPRASAAKKSTKSRATTARPAASETQPPAENAARTDVQPAATQPTPQAPNAITPEDTGTLTF